MFLIKNKTKKENPWKNSGLVELTPPIRNSANGRSWNPSSFPPFSFPSVVVLMTQYINFIFVVWYIVTPRTHNIRTYRCVDGGRRGRRQCAPFLRGYLPVDVDDLVPRESGTAQTRSKKRRRYVKKKEIAVRPLDRSITHTSNHHLHLWII